MNYYRIHGSDSGSDNGYFEVIVMALNKQQANRFFNYYLEDLGLSDCPWFKIYTIEKLEVKGSVLHSTIEVPSDLRKS